MPPPSAVPRPSRRIVFHGLGALGVAAVLAGCGGDDTPAAEEGSTSPTPSDPTSATPSREPEPSETERPSGKQQPAAVLAATDEVPVGGGLVLTAERIVLTQPRRGEFAAFSAICKHQGQIVGEVEDNVITCLYHGSQYDAATGDVVGGPAPTGLDPIEITVSKGRISRA